MASGVTNTAVRVRVAVRDEDSGEIRQIEKPRHLLTDEECLALYEVWDVDKQWELATYERISYDYMRSY